ncbi:MAG: M42 family metallopeptidase [Methanocellales archaeon]
MIEEIQTLISIDAPTGFEAPIRNYLASEMKKYVQEVKVDRFGNLIAIKPSKSKNPAKILLAAHMDEIGFIVRDIDENGFIAFNELGSWLDQVVFGMQVKILGEKKAVLGVVGAKPPHIMTEEERSKLIKIQDMFIDTGLTKQELEKAGVRVGSPIVPFSSFKVLNEKRIMGKAFDNRIGCTVLLETAKRLRNEELNSEVYFIFTSQEEVGLRGARTAIYEIEVDAAFVFECTVAGDVPNVARKDSPSELGRGAAITVMDRSMITQPSILNYIFSLAKTQGIKYQIKKPPSGRTDAGEIHLGKAGIPTAVISVPCRYIHSIASIADLDDIESTIALAIAILKDFSRERLREWFELA